MIRLYDYILKGDGSPNSNSLGWAKILQLPVHSSGYIASSNSGVKSYSDSNGLIEWYFPSGTIVSFTIPDVGIENKIITVPSSDSQISSI